MSDRGTLPTRAASSLIEFPALVLVHWPSGPVPCCPEHGEELLKLGNFLGSHIVATPITEPAECVNCLAREGRKVVTAMKPDEGMTAAPSLPESVFVVYRFAWKDRDDLDAYTTAEAAQARVEELEQGSRKSWAFAFQEVALHA